MHLIIDELRNYVYLLHIHVLCHTDVTLTFLTLHFVNVLDSFKYICNSLKDKKIFVNFI